MQNQIVPKLLYVTEDREELYEQLKGVGKLLLKLSDKSVDKNNVDLARKLESDAIAVDTAIELLKRLSSNKS